MRFSDWRCTKVRVRSWTAARVAPRADQKTEVVPRGRHLHRLLVDLGEVDLGVESEFADQAGQELLSRLPLLLQRQ